MFSSANKSTTKRVPVTILSGDVGFARRSKAALEASDRYCSEIVARPSDVPASSVASKLHIVEVSTEDLADRAALERHMQAYPATPVIVVSKGLAANEVRHFLKLGVADWLPSTCSGEELLLACDQALRPKHVNGAAAQARCTAFMSAVGGAGATTLSLAAVLALVSGRDSLDRACVVDLDLQRGTLADYVDVSPALQLDEIARAPERLDRHLLEIMLARHASGLSVLSAPPTLTGTHSVSAKIVGRLLDLAAADFEHLVLDLPTSWQPWSEDVVSGLDALYIVTEMSVTGLRQARQLAEMVGERCGVEVSGSVIVNKSRRFGNNVSRTQVRDALGPLLAGFVSHGGEAVRRAQDRGAMLASLGPRARIARDLAALLTMQKTRALGPTAIARSARA